MGRSVRALLVLIAITQNTFGQDGVAIGFSTSVLGHSIGWPTVFTSTSRVSLKCDVDYTFNLFIEKSIKEYWFVKCGITGSFYGPELLLQKVWQEVWVSESSIHDIWQAKVAAGLSRYFVTDSREKLFFKTSATIALSKGWHRYRTQVMSVRLWDGVDSASALTTELHLDKMGIDPQIGFSIGFGTTTRKGNRFFADASVLCGFGSFFRGHYFKWYGKNAFDAFPIPNPTTPPPADETIHFSFRQFGVFLLIGYQFRLR